MDEEEDEASDDELAACGLMAELVRSARIITLIGDILLEGLEEKEYPEETGEIVVLRGMIETAMPELLTAGASSCWQAADLIEKICSSIVTDCHLAADANERRN